MSNQEIYKYMNYKIQLYSLESIIVQYISTYIASLRHYIL